VDELIDLHRTHNRDDGEAPLAPAIRLVRSKSSKKSRAQKL
jgi:hypothetical protein